MAFHHSSFSNVFTFYCILPTKASKKGMENKEVSKSTFQLAECKRLLSDVFNVFLKC